jgi:hypothetical protein
LGGSKSGDDSKGADNESEIESECGCEMRVKKGMKEKMGRVGEKEKRASQSLVVPLGHLFFLFC